MKKIILLFLLCSMLYDPIFVIAKEKTDTSEVYPVPEELIQFFEDAGNQKAICPELLEAIAFYESRFFPDLKNENCVGIMQINVVIHRDRIKKLGFSQKDMYEPIKNITVAADILSELYEMYGDDNPYVIMYYAGQKKAMLEYRKSGRVSKYAQNVLDLSEKYERLHDK